MILDPNHEAAEYAVLAPDDFQDRGLGSILTDYCLEIARKWDIKYLEAQTTTDNVRMLSVFNKRDFEIRTPETSGALVEVSKKMK